MVRVPARRPVRSSSKLLTVGVLWLGLAAPVSPVLVGRAEAAPPKGAARSAARGTIPELMGKFTWGMSPDDVVKTLAEDIHDRYVELIKNERNTYKQDQLRVKEKEEVDKVRASLVQFDGSKSGWDSSIIEKEFVHGNGESMMIRWEKDQRRFLFFWQGKLYKQFIAFDASHPAFSGKTFDGFTDAIQARYGQAETKYSTLKTKDDVTVDHLEWPPVEDITLWAIDQSGFYGNFCLKLTQSSTDKSLESARGGKRPGAPRGNALIDAVTAPVDNKADPNEDILDRIVGKPAGGKPTK
jgi:hypothetical protein